MNNIFDAHAHYDDKWFDENRAELLDSMENTGVCGIVNAAVNLQSTEFALKLSEKYDSLPLKDCGYAIFAIGFVGMWLAPSVLELINSYGII